MVEFICCLGTSSREHVAFARYCASRVFGCYFLVVAGNRTPKSEFSVLFLGLNGAGKSTLLAAAAGEDTNNIQATTGFAIKVILRPKAILNMKELGGSANIRPHWNKYYTPHSAVVFLIDSAGTMESINESKAQLKECLSDAEFNKLPILVVCNKQDLPYARKQQEIVNLFELESMLHNKPHLVTSCSVEDVEPFKNSLDALVGLILASTTPGV
ncbi:hypothetical protein EMCRGX_G022563 [Ephydatia muelleri]